MINAIKINFQKQIAKYMKTIYVYNIYYYINNYIYITIYIYRFIYITIDRY